MRKRKSAMERKLDDVYQSALYYLNSTCHLGFDPVNKRLQTCSLPILELSMCCKLTGMVRLYASADAQQAAVDQVQESSTTNRNYLRRRKSLM
jgi:hypothetical protein